MLGFLSVGVLLGPYGLASLAPAWPPLSWFTFARPDQVEFLAELGVIFLMFMIGLEMSVERLWSMRRLVFGLGGLQVALSAAAVGGLALWFGNGIEAAVILGVVLAFSSTAIVMQLLIQRRELGTPLGQCLVRHPAVPGPRGGAAAGADQHPRRLLRRRQLRQPARPRDAQGRAHRGGASTSSAVAWCVRSSTRSRSTSSPTPSPRSPCSPPWAWPR